MQLQSESNMSATESAPNAANAIAAVPPDAMAAWTATIDATVLPMHETGELAQQSTRS